MKALFKHLAALLGVVLLASCGGGGGSAGEPPFGGGGGGGGGTADTPRITIALSSTTVTAAAPATVTAQVKSSTGSAIPGQVVNFTTGALGALSAPSALTNESGIATVTLTPGSASASGADNVTASVTVAGQSASASTGYQLTATNVAIASFTSDVTTLAPYAQTTLTVNLTGTTPSAPVNVVLSSACVSKGRATLTPTTATTSTGTATFTYRDDGCGAFDAVDGVQATVAGTSANASLQLTLTSPSASSILFVSAQPSSIYLRGSGFVENSNVTFKVADANGLGVPNQLVTLEATTLAGGLLLDDGSVPVTKRTDANGNVIVRINSGTVPTPVRIKATLDASGISTVSSSLAIAVGLPSQLNFSLSQQTINIEGYNIDNIPNTYTIIASDRLSNPVPVDTAINFVSEAGQIEAIRFIQQANGLSRAVANFVSSEPRPVDGRVTVMAYSLGEKSFLDVNGNNVYDAGEEYQDLGDVYLDRLLNGTYNAAEDQFISLSIAGSSACVTPASALLALNNSIPSRAFTNAEAPIASCTPGWGRAYVRRALQTIFSTSSARPMYGTSLYAGSYVPAGSTCPSPVTLRTGYARSDAPTTSSFFEFGSVALASQATLGVLSFIASDANPVAFNPMPAGTTVSVTSTEGLSTSVLGGSPVPNTANPSSVAIGYRFDDGVTAGVVTVTLRSPSGLGTTVSQAIRTTAAPAGSVSCP